MHPLMLLALLLAGVLVQVDGTFMPVSDTIPVYSAHITMVPRETVGLSDVAGLALDLARLITRDTCSGSNFFLEKKKND